MRSFLLVAASLLLAQGLVAGPLDDRRGPAPAAKQEPVSRISMLLDGHVIGLVELKTLDGDVAQFTVAHAEPVKVLWSKLPVAVQQAFAEDRVLLIAAHGVSLEQSLKTMGASGISGRIVQKVADGVLVRLAAPDRHISYTLFGGNTPTKISGAKINQSGPEGQIVIMQNLPNEELVAYDEVISVIGFPAGTWQYGSQTLTAYSAAPLAAK